MDRALKGFKWAGEIEEHLLTTYASPTIKARKTGVKPKKNRKKK
jgi:hypothetical protein